MTVPVPRGWHSVTPRIVVEDAAALIAFLERVFEAKGEFRTGAPSQIRIGDSLLMVSTASAREIFPAFLYVYVEDVGETCQRALDAGAALPGGCLGHALWRSSRNDEGSLG